jgi:lipopolysaccharide biosynthesis glycosyltransferase
MNKIYKGYITELSPKYNNYIYIEPIMKSPKVFHYIHGPKPWEDLNQFTKFCHEGYYYKGKRFNPR